MLSIAISCDGLITMYIAPSMLALSWAKKYIDYGQRTDPPWRRYP